MAASQPQWRIAGDYFENCNCDVVCPCLFSTAPQLTSRPTQGVCDVAFGFHINQGHYGDVTHDGLNAAVIPMRRSGPSTHTPSTRKGSRWRLATRGARGPTTACGGTTRARTVITRRSMGPTHSGRDSIVAARNTYPLPGARAAILSLLL